MLTKVKEKLSGGNWVVNLYGDFNRLVFLKNLLSDSGVESNVYYDEHNRPREMRCKGNQLIDLSESVDEVQEIYATKYWFSSVILAHLLGEKVLMQDKEGRWVDFNLNMNGYLFRIVHGVDQ